jgi:dephospho-CoA kinase
MLLIGLTGSIAMGKSTTAAAFRACGVPVFDADAAVHALYQGDAAPLVEAVFPGTTGAGGVDRAKLAGAVVGKEDAIRRLEAIVHPLVRQREKEFLAGVAAAGRRMAVLDIPLLFETAGDRRVDVVVVVSARPELQRERLMTRPGMTLEQAELLIARQVPDAEKRRRAHFVIDTSGPIEASAASVRDLVRALRPMASSH